MPMKLNAFFILLFLAASSLQAAPQFWNIKNATPTPPQPPDISAVEQPVAFLTATPTPVMAPKLQPLSPTPTPQPGLRAKNPTQAALFSVIIPGSGHVYAGDPLKGVVFAPLFGIGLWHTINNLQLVRDSSGNVISAKNETAGNLFGLGTLAAYGFGIQDAYNTA